MIDHFYEVHVQHRKDEYFVYYRCADLLEPDDVPAAAVRDRDLLALDARFVDYVLEITPEEYFREMFY